jgi:hypothetical protein
MSVYPAVSKEPDSPDVGLDGANESCTLLIGPE